jgi:hypothetical protein
MEIARERLKEKTRKKNTGMLVINSRGEEKSKKRGELKRTIVSIV